MKPNRISCYFALCHFAETHQDILNLIFPALDVVHDHILKYVLAILQLVHLVVRVCVQHWPAQKLSEWLKYIHIKIDTKLVESELNNQRTRILKTVSQIKVIGEKNKFPQEQTVVLH